MATDISICSQALLRLGAKAISSFSELSTGPLCGTLFPSMNLRVQTAHPWRFNTIKSEALDRLVATPPTEWKYRYQLPTNMINNLPRTVWDTVRDPAGNSTLLKSQFTNFNIYEDNIYTSAEQISVDFQEEKSPEVFPPHIEELSILAMVAVLAFPVTDQQNTRNAAFIEAWGEDGKSGYFKEAARIDSQGHPSQSIKNFPLIAVRNG